jgi:hypothetical protein
VCSQLTTPVCTVGVLAVTLSERALTLKTIWWSFPDFGPVRLDQIVREDPCADALCAKPMLRRWSGMHLHQMLPWKWQTPNIHLWVLCSPTRNVGAAFSPTTSLISAHWRRGSND